MPQKRLEHPWTWRHLEQAHSGAQTEQLDNPPATGDHVHTDQQSSSDPFIQVVQRREPSVQLVHGGVLRPEHFRINDRQHAVHDRVGLAVRAHVRVAITLQTFTRLWTPQYFIKPLRVRHDKFQIVGRLVVNQVRGERVASHWSWGGKGPLTYFFCLRRVARRSAMSRSRPLFDGW